MQIILQNILASLARKTLERHQPIVVGVTGSVGKSATKEAIALALSRHYSVRKTESNYNNEIGVPLTVLGLPSGGSNPLRWMVILAQGFWRAWFGQEYPEVLVVELGVDRPGDMERLLAIVSVQIGVVTDVSESHLEYFSTVKAIAKEKGVLVQRLVEGAQSVAVLNADNTLVAGMAAKTNAEKVITWGFSENAVLRGVHEQLLVDPAQTHFPSYTLKVAYEGKTVPLRLPHIAARHHLLAVLAALAVAASLKENLVETAQQLEKLQPLPGRLRFLPGKNGCVLIDDTYNASFVSTAAALETLAQIPAQRKVVMLGDMLELGNDSDARHRALAELLRDARVDACLLVGQHMHALYEQLQGVYPARNLLWFLTPGEARRAVGSFVQGGDTVLVKGSQGMRMEWLSEELVISDEVASEYLCRQSQDWKKQPFVFPVEWSRS